MIVIKTALWIELQAFAKDILTGLSIFHKQGTAHLDIKYENVFKTKTSGKDGGPKYKYAIADHTTAFNKESFVNKLAEKYASKYKNVNTTKLKETIWKDHYDEIYPKLAVGTSVCMAPENPYKSSAVDLPYKYNPCIADSYSAGVTIIDYAGVLLNIDVKRDKIKEELQKNDKNKLYDTFKKLTDDLTIKNWESRLSCTDALNSSFITAKIQ